MPSVSLIVPVYNGADYLKKGIDSILRQTFSDFEVILVDDGSTDGSGAVCDAYAAADSRVRAVHKENGGAGSARNRGIELAAGEYLMFPDADDWMEPAMLEEMVRRARETDADVVICGFRNHTSYSDAPGAAVRAGTAYFGTKQEVRAYVTSLFPDGVVGYPWNKLYKAERIRENALRFPAMRRYQDGMFNLAFFEHAGSCALLDRELYHYKVNDMADVFMKFPKNMYQLIEQFTEAYYEKLEQWDCLTSEAENRILAFYGNSVVSCLDNTYSDRWQMSGKERKAYIRDLRDKPRMRTVFARLEEIGGISRYVRLVLRLLKKNRLLRLRCAVRLKIFLKKHGRGVFERLKGL